MRSIKSSVEQYHSNRYRGTRSIKSSVEQYNLNRSIPPLRNLRIRSMLLLKTFSVISKQNKSMITTFFNNETADIFPRIV